MLFCLKMYKKLNNLYGHIRKVLTTHQPTTSFNNGFFFM